MLVWVVCVETRTPGLWWEEEHISAILCSRQYSIISLVLAAGLAAAYVFESDNVTF